MAARASRQGIKPLSLADLLPQLKREWLPNTVFFDVVPLIMGGGHWRISSFDPKGITLQVCDFYGRSDFKEFPQISIPHPDLSTTPLFTGVSIQHYSYKGKPIGLNEVQTIMHLSENLNEGPVDLRHEGESILFANFNGELVLPGHRLIDEWV